MSEKDKFPYWLIVIFFACCLFVAYGAGRRDGGFKSDELHRFDIKQLETELEAAQGELDRARTALDGIAAGLESLEGLTSDNIELIDRSIELVDRIERIISEYQGRE